jgi:hypothetical protein
MAKEDKKFCRLSVGREHGKQIYRLEFHGLGKSMKVDLEKLPLVDTNPNFYGVYLNKAKVRKIIKYLSNLLEQGDAISQG